MDIAPPPNPPKQLLANNEALAKLHGIYSQWFTEVQTALAGASTRQVLVVEGLQATAGASGALGSQVVVTVPSTPLQVSFRAQALDSQKRLTGTFVSGGASWTGSLAAGEQQITVTTAPGLTLSTVYAMTVVVLLG
jgi:hypothetical protein